MVLNRTGQRGNVSQAVSVGAPVAAQPPPRPASRRRPPAPPQHQQQHQQQQQQQARHRQPQSQRQQQHIQMNPLAQGVVARGGQQPSQPTQRAGSAQAKNNNNSNNNGKKQAPPAQAPSDGIGCLAAARQRPNYCGWCLSLVLMFQMLSFLFCIPTMAACNPFRIDDDDDDVGVCPNGFCSYANFAGIGWWMVTFWFYLGYCFNVCCGGSDKKFYNSADDAEDPKYHLEKMRKQFPVLTIYIRCFHHETRTRTVTSTDSQGRTSTRTETYIVDVVTHRNSEQFQYASWKDVSRPGMQCGSYKLAKCHFTIGYMCGDPATKQALQAQYERFVAANTFDVFQDHGVRLEVEGHKADLLCKQPGAEVPFWVGLMQYYFFSFCCFLVVPYRWAFAAISGDVQHHFSKMVTLAPAHAVGNGFIPAYQVAPELDSSGYEVLNDGRVKATFAGRENVYDTVEL